MLNVVWVAGSLVGLKQGNPKQYGVASLLGGDTESRVERHRCTLGSHYCTYTILLIELRLCYTFRKDFFPG
jgi:hypothetical protein